MAKILIFVAAIILGTSGLPTPDQHVRIDPSLDWRIVGGAAAAEGQFPYQVSMRSRSDSHSCGGSIIDETTILTAAHCVTGTSPSSITVVCGSNKLNSGGDRYAVSKIISHEGYDNFFKINDIALLKLEKAITFTDKIQPIKLATTVAAEGSPVILSGWGTTSYPGSAPNDLQWIELKTISNEECQRRHGWPIIVSTQVCTLTKAGEGACHGDSGGPLVSTDGEQVAVVNWGQPCARGYPDVFAGVAAHGEWINKNR